MLPKTPPRSEWIDSHGYEYETAKDFLLRNRAKTSRNFALATLHRHPYPQGYIQAWIEGYDYPTRGNHAIRCRNAERAAINWLYPPEQSPSSSSSGIGAARAGQAPDAAVRAAV